MNSESLSEGEVRRAECASGPYAAKRNRDSLSENDSVTPDPRPEKRRKASTKQWARIREQFRDESCQVCGKPWESLHHIVPRSLGGDDVAANMAPLCGSGTSGCHGLVEARENGARGRLAASLTHVQRVYILNKKGAGWLERNYPEWRDAA